MKKRTNTKRKTIMALVLVFMLTNFCLWNMSMASYHIENAALYSKGECGDLLRKDGSTVRVTYVVYSKDGTEYPAYCLDKLRPGVGESGNYTVDIDGVLNNVSVWKAIMNGYPYKTIGELGCSSEAEAFTATKMAVYSMLYGYTIENFSGIGEGGQRTLHALDQILKEVASTTETKISSDLTITQDNDQWTSDSINPKYISKTFKVTAKAAMQKYEIAIEGTMPEDTLVTDVQNNSKKEFSSGDKFKLLVPISQLGTGGKITIKATSGVYTKPIFYGKAPNSSWQDYAITGGNYEDGVGVANLEYSKNETKIKIFKQDTNTKEPLSGAVFDLYDAEKNIIKTNLVSNEKGEILLNDIMPGTYYLKETRAPGEYGVYEDFIQLDLSYNEEISVIVNNSKEDKTTVEVRKDKIEVTPKKLEQMKLPKTGM